MEALALTFAVAALVAAVLSLCADRIERWTR